jgi:hypothetical protein
MSKATIGTVITQRYGISEDAADAMVVEWAAEHLATLIGVDAAAKAWKRLNAKRHRAGRYTSIPAWGSPMWNAYFN